MKKVNKFKKVTAFAITSLLMLGMIPNHSYAIEEDNIHYFKQLEMGVGLKVDGTMWQWGSCFNGFNLNVEPIKMTDISNVVKIDKGTSGVGGKMTALTESGNVYHWAYNDHGGCPRRQMTGNNFVDIGDGEAYAIGIKKDGSMETYGTAGFYDGSKNIISVGSVYKVVERGGIAFVFTKENEQPLFRFGASTEYTKVSSARTLYSFVNPYANWEDRFYVVDKDRKLWLEKYNVITEVSGISNIKDIAAYGPKYLYALKLDGTVWTLNDGKISKMGNLENVVEIKNFRNEYLAIKKDGTAWIWNAGVDTPVQIPNVRVLNTPSMSDVNSAFEQAETSLTQEDLDTALELINQLPDSAEKTEFLNRVTAVQTQISVNKVTELTTTAENIVNSGSVDGLDEILLQIDSITNTLPDSVDKTNIVNKTNVIKAEGSKIKIDKLTQQANDLISSGNTEGLDEILLEIGSITNDLPNSAEKDQVIRDANLQSAKTTVSKAEITKTAEDIQLALDFTNKLPQSAEKVVLIERIYAVKGEPVPPMNDKTVLSSAENKLKLAETYKRDPYISNAEEAVNSLYDSPEKDAMLDRLETLRTSVEDEQLQKLVKTIESKVVMAEKYKKEAYINSAREALEQLPDGAEKEAFEVRLDALEEETPMDGTPSSARAVKVAVRATERAERTPTRYSIIYADRKTSALTDATPEKAGLVERVAVLKTQYQSVIAEQNAEKAIANAARYVELAEKYKNNYYFTKAEGLVNSLTDGDSKTTLSSRLEVLRPVIYPSAEQTLIDEAVKAVESAEKYPNSTAYVSRAVKAVELLPEGQIKTNLLERIDVLTANAA